MEEGSNDSNSSNKFLPSGKSVEASDCDEESSKEAPVLEPAPMPSEDVSLCLIGALATDKDVMQAAQSFNVPVVTSDDGSEWEHNATGSIIFVVEDFSGPIFEKLHGLGHRILGPTALRELVERGSPLPHNARPLYTLAMWGLVICFTGFHKKDELARLIKLIHNMGGSIRKDMSSNVTHLVANKCTGEKYQYALTFRVPVMAASWVHNAWAMRPHIGFNAADLQNNAEHKLKPFHGARVCLYGFPEEEQKHMTDILVENGGTPTDKDDPQCTHVVVECHNDGIVGIGFPNVQNSLSFSKLNKSSNTPASSAVSVCDFLTTDAVNNEFSVSPQLTSCLSNNIEICLSNNNNNNRKINFNEDSAVLQPKRLFLNDEFVGNKDCNDLEFKVPRCTENISSDLEFKSLSYDKNVDVEFKSPHCNDIGDSEFKSPQSVLNNDKSNGCLSSTPICFRNHCRLANGFEEDNFFDDKNTDNERNTNIRDNFKNSCEKIYPDLDVLDDIKESAVRHENMRTRCSNKFFEDSLTNSLSLSMMEKLVPRSRMSVCLPSELKLTPDIRLNNVNHIGDDRNLASPKAKKRRQTLSPKKDKIISTPKKNVFGDKSSSNNVNNNNGGFKTPIFCALRRSLRLKSVNHLTRWLSTTDIPPNDTDRNRLPSPEQCTDPNSSNHPSHSPSVPVHNSCLPEKMVVEEDACDNLDRPHHHRMQYNSVIDESTISSLPAQVASSTTFIVKAEWFWASVQNEGCVDEKDYLFEDYLESLVSPSRRTPTSASTTPLSVSSRARKRKRLQEVVSRMVASGGTTPAVNKRRSSVSDAGLLSCTPSPTTQLTDETEAVNAIETPRKHMSFRHQVFLELVQTETNYVGILSTIMTMFKEPLEKMCETEDQLLNLTEIKIIFGHLPPIYQTHCQMLEQLKWAASHWTEDVSIGNIILKFAPDLVKAYPPFVNFFENTTEMLVKCDQTKPRFHAFLKKCQTKPECGRQSLQELLIRPIQRLPSIILLLNDILKHTNKSNNDHSALEAALNVIREVMSHINEDKRRTEGQLAIFDIFNDIDNCPPHLVSSHRSFIARCDLTEISDSLSGRGDPLAFFLFSDILEVCKKRSKAFSNSLKSPNATSGTNKLSNCKPFKHVRLMPLSTIKRVIDIKETDECHKVFALMCKSNQELKEKLYSFMITDEDIDKMVFLKSLCRQMANTVCRADAENFLASLDPEQLDIDTSDVGLGTLGKAFKFASRTRMRVGRAFSFNKTPSKLKRAMSTMMSPFGSSSNLTPASQLAQMRLASCNNLNELTGGSGVTPPALPPPQYAVPMSVQPQRRSKHSTLSVASLRRL